jgi:hypothetical protein
MPRSTVWVHLASSFLLGVLMSGDGWADDSADGSADGAGKRPLEPLDAFRIQFASDPQVAPDGTQVAYVRNFMDIRRDRKRSHLWGVDADGGGHRPLVAADDRDASQPRWSPDGTRLAYVSKAVGDKDAPSQLYCRWNDTGQSARLAELEREPEHVTWSPDGRHIAFTMLVPADPEPLVLDMATSLVAMGRIHDHANRGEAIPAGWALDAQGRATTDAGAAKAGAIAPFGGAKGYALGLALELLVTSLAGSAIGTAVHGTLDSDSICNKGDLFIVISPRESASVTAAIHAYLDEIRASAAPDTGQPVSVPGDRSPEARARSIAEGVEVDDTLWCQILALMPPSFDRKVSSS